ncbi:MAG: P-II family nitrogen regulator [Candidatus Nitrosopolaris sp.]|jgi:nitrogen regulatory protein P-II 1
MRKIDVIVAHERLIEINEIIHKHKVGGMTFYNIKGRGRSKLEPVDSDKGILRHTPEFQTRIKCEILVSEHMIRPIVDEILKVIKQAQRQKARFLYMMLWRHTI